MSDPVERLKTALADRYTIERELGRGGMAVVYLAEDVKHGRYVAVKVLLPELAATLGGDRFLQEIRVTAKLTHPHILTLIDSGEADGLLYYVMPYVEGESLRDCLKREKQLPVEDALQIAEQVASALDFAHRHHVIHRDIKPENILLHEGVAMVADFGIALAVKAAGGERLTETGLSIGTPEYMSPEQVAGERTIDARSDIYSLACVLYEMLAGQPPFTGATGQAVLARHVTDAVPPITTVRSGLLAPVACAIAKALNKAPADRFASAKAFAEALSAEVGEAEAEIKSIVVLPFENLSPDPENEYFSDGLTDELIADLSKLHSLRVISRNSAMQLKGTDKDTKAIGRELNVQYVLEGTVRRAADRLRITAQLIDAVKDAHLWTEKYDGVLEDVFDMQEKVSRSIVGALELRLTQQEHAQLERRSIEQLQAYEYYLRARYEIGLFSKESLDRALELVDRGLEIAGDNDVLCALKGGVYLQYVNMMSAPPVTYQQLLNEGRRFAEKALELNPGSAQAECTIGGILHQSGNPRASISHMEKALRLSPNLAEANAMLGFQLAAAGRDLQRAGCLLDKAGELDPLTWWFNRGWLDMYGCDFARALTSFRVGQQVSEDSRSPFRMAFVWLHAAGGNEAEAFRLVDQMAADSASHPMTSAGLFLKYALLGEKDQALDAVTEELRAAAWWDDHWSLVMADAYALIEERDDAFRWLDHAIDYGYCSTRFLECEPLLANLRTDDRFDSLLEKAAHMSECLLD